MAFRLAILKSTALNTGNVIGVRRWAHFAVISSPLDRAIEPSIPSPPIVLPEFNGIPKTESNNIGIGFGFPSLSFGGSMELMAVPKKKTSKHKRGIRNGPKALKPTPVIIRCRSCGRVKLPHFYCCSGERGQPSEHNN